MKNKEYYEKLLERVDIDLMNDNKDYVRCDLRHQQAILRKITSHYCYLEEAIKEYEHYLSD